MPLFGLFKSEKKDTKENLDTKNVKPKKFNKIKVETDDVLKELKKISKEYQIPLNELDFRILKVKTLYKKASENIYKELKDSEYQEFFTEENILNAEIKIHQVLRIEVFKIQESQVCPIKMTLSGNPKLTKIIATIKQQDRVDYSDDLEERLIAAINNKRARLGILIDVFDNNFHDEIKRVISNIRVNLAILEDIEISVCEGFDEIAHIYEEIIFVYKEKNRSTNKNDRVDHSNRGFQNAVKKGEVVIRVIKPKEGRNGRDTRGKIIDVGEFKQKDVPKITVGKEIEVIDEVDATTYIAKKDGFICEVEKYKYDIVDELIVDEATFRTTGSVLAGDDKDIKINVRDSDHLKDSIGSGVHIDTAEIFSNGNVGSGAVLKANIIEIGGQTHQSAKLKAKKIKINIHKGFAEGDLVEINSLEAGKVVADVAKIGRISGGEVIAREIYIDTLMSNSNLKASHLIQIEQSTGTHNSLIMDSTAQKGYDQKVKDIKTEQKEIQKKIDDLKYTIKRYRFNIQKEKGNVEAINKRVKELKRDKIEVPMSFMLKLKNYQKLIKEHNNLLEELKALKYRQKELNDKLLEIQSSVFKAKIVHNASWQELNEIRFIVLKPSKELRFMPKKDQLLKEISIEKSRDDEVRFKFVKS